MPMQHVFSFTLAEAWAFLIYAAGAAAGLYSGAWFAQRSGTYDGNNTLDNVPATHDYEPKVISVHIQRLCIIGDSETIKARAKELGLPVQTVTATLIGPASAGDSMELWGMSKTEGEEYFARYTTKEDYL